MLRRSCLTAFLLAVFCTVRSEGGESGYSAARDAAVKGCRPLLVYVGAEWCGPCRTMKARTLPKLKLKGVVFAVVDYDRQPKLSKLLGVRAFPTLVLYVPVGKGWRRYMLVGYVGPERVEAFVKRAVKRSKVAPGGGAK